VYRVRWRSVTTTTTTLIAQVEDDGILSEEELDELADGLL
jgi:hypothetical protein